MHWIIVLLCTAPVISVPIAVDCTGKSMVISSVFSRSVVSDAETYESKHRDAKRVFRLQCRRGHSVDRQVFNRLLRDEFFKTHVVR